MSRFLEALHSGRVLLMDGAMGTELIRAGLDPEQEPGELWNLTHPEKVRAIHQAYVDAGADLLLTNTFQANVGSLQRYGQAEQLHALTEAAIQSACQTATNARLVLLDVGPFPPEQRYESGGQMLAHASHGPIHGMLVETCSGLADVKTILKHRSKQDRKKGGQPLPVLLSCTYRRQPKHSPVTRHGRSPEACAESASRLDIAALGVNCGRDVGIDEILDILRRYRHITELPLFARPNAGTPTRTADGWEYPLTPAELARRLPELLAAGITMFGGCCGTTPAHLAACRPVIDEWNRRHAPGATTS